MRGLFATVALLLWFSAAPGAEPVAKPAARPPIVLDGKVLRFRAPELGAGKVVPKAVAGEDGKPRPLAAKDLVRYPDGWLVVTVPEGLRAGTVTLVPEGGPPQVFTFRSEPVAPVAANPKWDAARRAQCLAVAGSWFGTIRGNDPDAKATVSLEIDADCRTVYGILNWRSARSGVNDRVLRGTWDPERRILSAADVRLDVDQPLAGYRFCAIDRYTLALSADGIHLDGEYFSEECRDHAMVDLARPEQPATK